MTDNQPVRDVESGEGSGQRATISNRFSRLATLPVDTTALDRAVVAIISPRRRYLLPWRLAASGLAAALILMAVILIPLLMPHNSRASTRDLSRLYERMVAAPSATGVGGGPTKDLMRMCSPEMGRLASCCLQTIHHHQVACMLVKHGKQTVGLVVVPAGELAYPQGHLVHKGGRSFIVQTSGRLNMVIRPGKQHWVCVMGLQSVNDLLTIANQLRPIRSGAGPLN